MDPLTLVLLPGLDGTGKLFAPLIDELPDHTIPLVLNYISLRAESYSDYCDHVRSKLPNESPYFILGESFSGPIALLLAAQSPENCQGLILGCAFASSVIPDFLPNNSTLSAAAVANLPRTAMKFALTNTYKQTATTRLLDEVLSTLDPSIIAARLRLIVDFDIREKLTDIELPVLYLRASADKLIGIRAAQEVIDRLPNVNEEVIRGPHLLLQTEPRACAFEITRFIEKPKRR